jgi:hypothetical protein
VGASVVVAPVGNQYRYREEWPSLFGGLLLSSAALARLRHHAHVIEMHASGYSALGAQGIQELRMIGASGRARTLTQLSTGT